MNKCDLSVLNKCDLSVFPSIELEENTVNDSMRKAELELLPDITKIDKMKNYKTNTKRYGSLSSKGIRRK